MAPWTALNIEPESDNEDVEYDNTKELQIEEALKLYQTALKLHSQGPQYYTEADLAYSALFDSEIFKYPESLTQLDRFLEHGNDDDFEDEAIAIANDTIGVGDSVPSTLPQILYLSFKNRGQFLLDRLVHHQQARTIVEDDPSSTKDVLRNSLHLLSEALDKDSSDPDLWRRLAKLGQYVGSQRLARFALESAYSDEEQDPGKSILEGFDLDEVALEQELQKLIGTIEGDKAEPYTSRLPLFESLSLNSDPLDVLPQPEKRALVDSFPSLVSKPIRASQATWEAVGNAILEAREASLQNGGESFISYLLILQEDTQDLPMTGQSPTMLTSDSLGKRRFSKDPDLTKRQTLGTQAGKGTSSPTIMTQSLDLPTSDNPPASAANAVVLEQDSQTTIQLTSQPRPPTKRTSESAGLQENADGVRSRSKRLRARAETIAEDLPDTKAINKQIEEQLGVYSRADDWVFNVAYEIGCRFGCKWIGNAETIREAITVEDESAIDQAAASDPWKAPLHDFRQILASWTANRSSLLLNGTGIGASAVLIDDGSDSGSASFMERSKLDTRRSCVQLQNFNNQGLQQWYGNVKTEPQDLDQLSLSWIRAILEPRKIANGELQSAYLQYVWSGGLKDSLMEILINYDDTIYTFANNTEPICSDGAVSASQSAMTAGLIQAIFEIHIDAYTIMVAPDSKADQPSRAAQRDRLRRWALLSTHYIGAYAQQFQAEPYTTCLFMRQLWAQVAHVGLVEASARDHILLCYQDLQQVFEAEGSPSYTLPNNSAMPEVSLDALKQELLQEKTMDFFQGIFGPESKDPVTLIENLEPVLMETFDCGLINLREDLVASGLSDSSSALPQIDEEQDDSAEKKIQAKSYSSQLADFITKATVQLKLSLWHQLKGAYNRIDYPGMKVVCNFRSMILILRELHSESFAQETQEGRAGNLIIWIRNLADLVGQTLDTIRTHAKALDCLAELNLDLALEACALVTRLFHVFALWEDSVRIGQATQPTTPGAANTYKNAMTFLRETQPKVWHLLYLIYKEAFSQDISLNDDAGNDLIELIKAIHCSFGNREYCRVGRKNLMKFMKSELLRLDGPEEEIAQALYDLYGLKITTNPNSIWEHHCGIDTIDRTSALEIVDYVMSQATSINIKDLLKTDIRAAIDKMQAVIGIPRAVSSATQQSFNRRLITNFLKGPVHKTQMQRSIRGFEGLSTMTIRSEYATVASKRWFFLVGLIHLTKYRTTKRVAPNNTDDLDLAITFLKLDLDFDPSNWETWLRLGQAFDLQLAEEVLWSADVINEKPEELTQWERSAIHCYEMAASLAVQRADNSRDTRLKLAELYSDFAHRLYSSTRSPFDAKVFDVSRHKKYINQEDKGTYSVPAFKDFHLVDVWKLCEMLYQRALETKLEDDWYIWYMRGKCRWKLWKIDQDHRSWRSPIEAIVKAVEHLPGKKDSRHADRDPILEPHYKLLSMVWKLTKGEVVTPEEGFQILQTSLYAKKIKTEGDLDWRAYSREFLQVLRAADKSNWHHRLIVRAADWAYDDHEVVEAAAQACKDRMSQHIVTKTMAIQIWKPEYERPGRHFVYTSKYVRGIINLLEKLGERPVLEILGKRIRKKQNEYIDPVDIFDNVCEAHMRLVRSQGQIPEKSEERVFHQGMAYEYFMLNAGRLETWAHSQLSLTNTTLPLLTEVWELKRLSGSILEKGPFEELMMDIYACLFEKVVPDLIARAGEAENRERMRIDRMLLDNTIESAQGTTPEATAVSSRPKQISKTEVKRRAEGLVAKAPLPSVKAKAATAREATPEAKPKERMINKRDNEEKNNMRRRGSTADAESELSSVPDSDMEEPPLISGPSGVPKTASRAMSTTSDADNEEANVSKMEEE